MKTRTLLLSALLAVATVGLMSTPAQAQNVNQRLKNQNGRIKNGVKNGELTRNQVDRLRAHDANVRARELRDKSRDNGHLTARERQNLNRSLNRNSKAIYRDKHDAAAHGG